ncbi:MAG: hypothetical protein HOO06_03555 [Bdellovibrionaceae bacterium]|jgi:hypothetical protein|nr:hypothetical protein [Pseudobdellovibrionaceae bacterium]
MHLPKNSGSSGVIIPALNESNRTYMYCLQQSWLSIIILSFLVFGLHGLFDLMLAQMPKDEFMQLNSKLGKLFTDLMPTALYIFTIPYYLHRKNHPSSYTESLGEFTKRTLLPLIVASIRTFVEIIIGLLLLIIPGIYKMAQLQFVPFAVYFSTDDKSDPLAQSKLLSKNTILVLLFVVILEPLLGLIFQAAPGYIFDAPPKVLPIVITTLKIAISIYTYSFLYYLYKAKLHSLKGNQ